MSSKEATVHIAEDAVVVRRSGNSAAAVAKILGVDEKDGVRVIYLDRLIHKPFESELGGYTVSGAISTIVTAPALQVADAEA